MNKDLYRPRLIDRQLELELETFGDVCIEGAKCCGKTWTSMHHSRNAVFLGDQSGMSHFTSSSSRHTFQTAGRPDKRFIKENLKHPVNSMNVSRRWRAKGSLRHEEDERPHGPGSDRVAAASVSDRGAAKPHCCDQLRYSR